MRQLQPGGREVMESGTIPLQARGHLSSEGACAVAACDVWYVRSVSQLESRVRKHELTSIDRAVCFHHLARKLAIRVSELRPVVTNVSALQRTTPRALPSTALPSLPYARKLFHRRGAVKSLLTPHSSRNVPV